MPNQSEIEKQIQDIYAQGEIDMIKLKSKIRLQKMEMEYMKEISEIKALYFNKAIEKGIHESIIISAFIM